MQMTVFFIALEVIMIFVAVLYWYMSSGPPGEKMDPAKRGRYRLSSRLAIFLAALVLVRLLTHTYN
jgi:hypothetical protein